MAQEGKVLLQETPSAVLKKFRQILSLKPQNGYVALKTRKLLLKVVKGLPQEDLSLLQDALNKTNSACVMLKVKDWNNKRLPPAIMTAIFNSYYPNIFKEVTKTGACLAMASKKQACVNPFHYEAMEESHENHSLTRFKSSKTLNQRRIAKNLDLPSSLFPKKAKESSRQTSRLAESKLLKRHPTHGSEPVTESKAATNSNIDAKRFQKDKSSKTEACAVKLTRTNHITKVRKSLFDLSQTENTMDSFLQSIVKVVCSDGTISVEKILAGLCFPELATSQVYQLPVDQTLLLPEHTVAEVRHQIDVLLRQTKKPSASDDTKKLMAAVEPIQNRPKKRSHPNLVSADTAEASIPTIPCNSGPNKDKAPKKNNIVAPSYAVDSKSWRMNPTIDLINIGCLLERKQAGFSGINMKHAPKSVLKDLDEILSSSQSKLAEIKSDTDSSTSPKRKRGRPPLNKILVGTDLPSHNENRKGDEIGSDLNSSTLAERKKGRPPMNKNLIGHNLSSDFESVKADGTKSDHDSSTASIRGRGRPPSKKSPVGMSANPDCGKAEIELDYSGDKKLGDVDVCTQDMLLKISCMSSGTRPSTSAPGSHAVMGPTEPPGGEKLTADNDAEAWASCSTRFPCSGCGKSFHYESMLLIHKCAKATVSKSTGKMARKKKSAFRELSKKPYSRLTTENVPDTNKKGSSGLNFPGKIAVNGYILRRASATKSKTYYFCDSRRLTGCKTKMVFDNHTGDKRNDVENLPHNHSPPSLKVRPNKSASHAADSNSSSSKSTTSNMKALGHLKLSKKTENSFKSSSDQASIKTHGGNLRQGNAGFVAHSDTILSQSVQLIVTAKKENAGNSIHDSHQPSARQMAAKDPLSFIDLTSQDSTSMHCETAGWPRAKNDSSDDQNMVSISESAYHQVDFVGIKSDPLVFKVEEEEEESAPESGSISAEIPQFDGERNCALDDGPSSELIAKEMHEMVDQSILDSSLKTVTFEHIDNVIDVFGDHAYSKGTDESLLPLQIQSNENGNARSSTCAADQADPLEIASPGDTDHRSGKESDSDQRENVKPETDESNRTIFRSGLGFMTLVPSD